MAHKGIIANFMPETAAVVRNMLAASHGQSAERLSCLVGRRAAAFHALEAHGARDFAQNCGPSEDIQSCLHRVTKFVLLALKGDVQ